jgi:peptidoglycan/LPS O-acetylase OafA/YrhL
MRSPLLRRITSGGAIIPEIDGLRGLLTGIVVLVHLQLFLMMRFGFSNPGDLFTRLLLTNGARALPVFFVMSGFMLGHPWAAHYLKGGPAVSLKQYYLRRITRLEPPYVVSMVMMFVIYSISAHHGYSIRFWFERLCASLLYIHNIVYGESSKLNAVAWSLEVEIQFYCLVPLLTLALAVQNPLVRRGLLIGTAFCAGLASLLWMDVHRMHDSIATYLQFFLAGILLADLYVTNRQDTGGRHWSWDVIGLMAGLPVWCLGAKWFTVVGPFLILVSLASIFRGIWLRSLFSHPLLTFPGGMCYSVYLLHNPIMAKALVFSTRLFTHANHYLYLLLQLGMMTIVVGFCSTIFFLLVERPCMRKDWPQRLWSSVHGRCSGALKLASIQEDSV